MCQLKVVKSWSKKKKWNAKCKSKKLQSKHSKGVEWGVNVCAGAAESVKFKVKSKTQKVKSIVNTTVKLKS